MGEYESYISPETAILSEEKGFNIPCLRLCVKGQIQVYPSQSLLQKWLREIHGIDVLIDSIGGKSGYYFVIKEVETGDKLLESMRHDKYEHVLELGLKEALRIIP